MIKNLILLIFFLGLTMNLTSCGDDHITYQELPVKVSVGLPAPIVFQGYYLLPEGGYVDMVEDTGGLIDISLIRLVIVNNNGSTGVVPITGTNLVVRDNKHIQITNNYTLATTNNIRRQGSNTVLAGSHYITTTFSFDENKRLKVDFVVRSNTSGDIELRITIKELE